MSELKCPFCQQGLQPTSIFDNRDKRCVWYCPNCATNKGLWVMANERVWQELISTRKALDVAVDALKDIAESNGDFITGASTPLDEHEYADMMLKEIKRQMKIKTALEQKDKQCQ